MRVGFSLAMVISDFLLFQNMEAWRRRVVGRFRLCFINLQVFLMRAGNSVVWLLLFFMVHLSVQH